MTSPTFLLKPKISIRSLFQKEGVSAKDETSLPSIMFHGKLKSRSFEQENWKNYLARYRIAKFDPVKLLDLLMNSCFESSDLGKPFEAS